MAAWNGHFKICEFFIRNLAEKNPAKNDGVTPLFRAAQNGQFRICKLIIENVENKNPARNDGVRPHTHHEF